MHLNVFEKILSNLMLENRLVKCAIVTMALVNVFLAIQVRQAFKHERTILVPAYLDSRVTIRDGYASQDYILSFGRVISALAFSYNSGSARSQFGELLQYYAPDKFSEGKKIFYDLADTIEQGHITSSFVINQAIELNQKDHTMTLVGTLKRWIDTRALEAESKSYMIEYRVVEGRFQVVSISERMPADHKGPAKPKDAIKLIDTPTAVAPNATAPAQPQSK